MAISVQKQLQHTGTGTLHNHLYFPTTATSDQLICNSKPMAITVPQISIALLK